MQGLNCLVPVCLTDTCNKKKVRPVLSYSGLNIKVLKIISLSQSQFLSTHLFIHLWTEDTSGSVICCGFRFYPEARQLLEVPGELVLLFLCETGLQTQSWPGTPSSECWDQSHTPSWVSLSLSTMSTWRYFRRTIYAWVPDSLKKESGEIYLENGFSSHIYFQMIKFEL